MTTTAPKIYQGDLAAQEGVVYDFIEITGYLDCRNADANTQFPNLTTIGGSANFQGWIGNAPKLTTIRGYANFQGWTGTAPKLTTIGGSANFSGWTGSAPKLTTIGNYASFSGWTGSAPKLTTIGDYANFQGWMGSAPNLTTIGGYTHFRCWTSSAPKLTTIGSYADFRGWTGDAPNLTTICSWADFRSWTGSAPKLTVIGGNAALRGWNGSGDTSRIKTNVAQPELSAALAKQGLALNDGILAHTVSSKGNVKRVRIVGKTKISYVVEQDGQTAHGATLEEARADLLVKIGKRDTTPYKAWTLATEASLQDMIVAYRVITGACSQGVSNFLAARNLPCKLTVERAIAETSGKYGCQQFAEFFNGKK